MRFKKRVKEGSLRISKNENVMMFSCEVVFTKAFFILRGGVCTKSQKVGVGKDEERSQN